MSDANEDFRYGLVSFFYIKDFSGREIAYTAIPCAYLCQDMDTKELFVFKTIKEMEDYFKGNINV